MGLHGAETIADFQVGLRGVDINDGNYISAGANPMTGRTLREVSGKLATLGADLCARTRRKADYK
jgi:hypothetical protein